MNDRLDEVRGWLAQPNWPHFGPGIGPGQLDPGRVAARAAVEQVLDVLTPEADLGAAIASLKAALPEDALWTLRKREGGTYEAYAQGANHISLGFGYGATEVIAIAKLIKEVNHGG